MKLFYILAVCLASTYAAQTIEDRLAVYNAYQANLAKVQVKYINNEKEFGLIASQDIQRGEIVMAIPSSLIISSFDNFPLKQYVQQFNEEVIFITRILYEKFMNTYGNVQTSWIRAFPEKMNMYLNWTQEEIQSFWSQTYTFQPVRYPPSYNASYEEWAKALKKVSKTAQIPLEMLSKQNFTWGAMIVLSRSQRLEESTWRSIRLLKQTNEKPKAKEKQGVVLYPILDLVNHEPLPYKFRPSNSRLQIVKTQVEGEHAVAVMADRSFKAGDEFVFDYGFKTNIQLVILYGFNLEQNLDDQIMVSIVHDPSKYSQCSQDGSSQPFKWNNVELCDMFLPYSQLSNDLLDYEYQIFPNITALNHSQLAESQECLKDHIEVLMNYRRKIMYFVESKNFTKVEKQKEIEQAQEQVKLNSNLTSLERMTKNKQISEYSLIHKQVEYVDRILISLYQNCFNDLKNKFKKPSPKND